MTRQTGPAAIFAKGRDESARMGVCAARTPQRIDADRASTGRRIKLRPTEAQDLATDRRTRVTTSPRPADAARTAITTTTQLRAIQPSPPVGPVERAGLRDRLRGLILPVALLALIWSCLLYTS
uniref:hypothetical protein n=1 Tax=Pantanalinema rosaneae TaxID=1620701 RepID=UPI003D6DB044